MLAYVFLEEECHRLHKQQHAMSLLGRPGAKSSVAIVGMCSIGFMGNSNPTLNLTPNTNFSRLEPTQPKSTKIEF
jgi:hypothetical protein